MSDSHSAGATGFVNVAAFLHAVECDQLERRRHHIYSFRLTVTAAPEYHETIATTLQVFTLRRSLSLWRLNVAISESSDLFHCAAAEFERRASPAQLQATGTRLVKVAGGLMAVQDIPTSVRTGGEPGRCIIVGSVAKRAACVVFPPQSHEAKHTFIRACLVTLLCQSRAYHCVHGGAVALNGKGVLLIGPRQSGKTTTLLRLHLAGFDILSDNLSFVRDGSIIPFFLMHQPMLNLGPDAYATVAPLIGDAEAAATPWNQDGRRLIDLRSMVRPAAGHVPLSAVVFPQLSSAFGVTRLDPETAMKRFSDDFIVPEVELFARKFRRAWYFRWKCRRYWNRQLRDIPLLAVSLDRTNMDSSIDKLKRLLA